MEIKIKSQHLNLSDQQRESIERKVEKLTHLSDRLTDESTEIKVEVKHEKTRQHDHANVCQITIFAPQSVIRSESRKDTLENAIDDAVSKIRSQIERYKAKMHRTDKRGSATKEIDPESFSEEEFEIPKILRRKRFSNSKPMTEEAAIEQMELIGHGFFLFNNADTGRFSIVYKRDDGYYGIIEPKMDND